MTRFSGLLRTDGAPLQPATTAPFFRSRKAEGWSDGEIWHQGSLALGSSGQTPALETGVAIVGDARLDARAGLVAKLALQGVPQCMGASDVDLIRHAYLRWGEACVDHLLGDFSFAIWDTRRNCLFCARDHMGVKPFYYAQVGRWMIISNALDCIRQHYALPNELNDAALADCLLFGSNQDSATTVYRDIMRLPAGHSLTLTSAGLRVRRYWSLPVEEPVYYRRARDYVDRFNELLHVAVADRLDVGRVGVFMSGGLDSTLLAATAKRVLQAQTTDDDQSVRSYTFGYQTLIDDPEPAHAAVAARHLGIPLRVQWLDAPPRWLGAEDPATPEPLDYPADRRPQLQTYAAMANHSGVAFYGEGPDNALRYEWRAHLNYLSSKHRWVRLASDVGTHIVSHRRLPLLGTIARRLCDRTPSEGDPEFPSWMNADLVKRLGLHERWRQVYAPRPSLHPTRPSAHASLQSPLWQALFEAFDPAYTRAPLEVRHPFVDIRLLRYMLTLPALPWCRNKHIMRHAGRGLLPETTLSRAKRPLVGSPAAAHVKRYGPPPIRTDERLARFIDKGKFSVNSHGSSESATFRLAAVSHWLSHHPSSNPVQRGAQQ